MNSKKQLIKTLEGLPRDAWLSSFYDLPVLEGRRFSYSFKSCVLVGGEEEHAEDVLKSLRELIEDMPKDLFLGHWNMKLSTGDRAYLGGPGSQPPPKNGD